MIYGAIKRIFIREIRPNQKYVDAKGLTSQLHFNSQFTTQLFWRGFKVKVVSIFDWSGNTLNRPYSPAYKVFHKQTRQSFNLLDVAPLKVSRVLVAIVEVCVCVCVHLNVSPVPTLPGKIPFEFAATLTMEQSLSTFELTTKLRWWLKFNSSQPLHWPIDWAGKIMRQLGVNSIGTLEEVAHFFDQWINIWTNIGTSFIPHSVSPVSQPQTCSGN